MNDHSKHIPDPDLVIEVKQVYKSFKTVQAVRGIDARFHQGEFVALLGPNVLERQLWLR